MSKKRIGIALPVGMRGKKEQVPKRPDQRQATRRAIPAQCVPRVRANVSMEILITTWFIITVVNDFTVI